MLAQALQPEQASSDALWEDDYDDALLFDLERLHCQETFLQELVNTNWDRPRDDGAQQPHNMRLVWAMQNRDRVNDDDEECLTEDERRAVWRRLHPQESMTYELDTSTEEIEVFQYQNSFKQFAIAAGKSSH